VVGASVILFDPIFQGLAISLMAGEIAGTLLSPVVIPLLYYLIQRGSLSEPSLEPDLVGVSTSKE